MTERFTLSDKKYDGTIFDDGKSMGCIDIVDMLNALNDENEQLKGTNQKLNEEVGIFQMDLCKTKSYEQLEKENKRLKQKIKDIVTIDARDYNKLYEENEQLKEQREKLFFRERDTKNRWRELKQENEKLWREIHILMRQGAEPSDYFKEYLDSVSTEYDKFWQRKLHKAKESKVI